MKRNVLDTTVHYTLDRDGNFTLYNYQQAIPFSNFFPGVAGLWGIPMWVFYVNRGQAVSSFGIESKDKAMLEFLPANKAYRMTGQQGFRTFVKLADGKKTVEWEPFSDPASQAAHVEQNMTITAHDLSIEEVNHTLKMVCRVNYFTLPEEPFPALIRRVTFENIGKKDRSLEVADGLPVYLPYGMNDWVVKNMSRTVEAWVKVRDLEKRTPYYQLNVEVADTPDVRHIKRGNFYFSFLQGGSKLLPVSAQPECVFGASTGLAYPQGFYGKSPFRLPADQQTSNRTPSAMTVTRLSLSSGKSKTLVSVMGHADSREEAAEIAEKVTHRGLIERKADQNRDIVSGIKNCALTCSSSPVFDQYTMQTFLDNVLRGGLPISLETGEGPVAFNVFSRKHGDPERDYNFFLLAPTYYSQGNGNYRDVNQNRRNDIWFNTDVARSSIETFFNLSQADGYNPLVVKGMSFFAEDTAKAKAVLKKTVRQNKTDDLLALLEKGFQPGELLAAVDDQGFTLTVSPQEFLGKVIGVCRKQTLADHGEGFWVDHWTYNIDLIESYLSIFPERLRPLLIEDQVFSFFHNDHYVLPRSQRYILTEHGVRQYHSVYNGEKSIPAARGNYLLRCEDGLGKVYHTNLLVKLLCLITNKAATFDPAGMGIEMEADKPGWYDALNGLPGLLGSSLCETFELRRYARFVLEALDQLGVDDHYELCVYDELGEFIKDLSELLETENDALAYWNQANEIKENYRLSIRKGIRGDEEGVSIADIRAFLKRVVERTEKAEKRAQNKQGLIPTYFAYDVKEYDTLQDSYEGQPYVMPRAFRRHALPLFLEGFVHALRVEQDPEQARKRYQAVRRSALYDKKLKMYKVNADLSDESEDIGRARVFPRGWLENESVWLHMEYKYLLEILRSGLYREFYETMHHVLIPFLKPEDYGRSPLENSSFLVSSAHEDPSLHGRGFVARLSGSTAEFMHMWLWMSIGRNPFVLNAQKELCLHFDPVLSGDIFTAKKTSRGRLDRKGAWQTVDLPKGSYAFHFLSSTLVVYHNPQRRDIFPDTDYRIERITLEYAGNKKPVVLTDGFIPAPYAEDVRCGKVERIDVDIV
ncbi:MAG: hypothetical protein ACLFPX_01215 [Candidatus Omnitrophota bacterium]